MIKIRNIEELKRERIRLESEFTDQKLMMKSQINTLKHKFDPIIQIGRQLENIHNKAKATLDKIKALPTTKKQLCKVITR